MAIIRLLIDLATDPLNYSIVWLIFSWLIWLFLKLFKWARPTPPTMLIYSAAVIIVFIRDWQEITACMKIELCYQSFELLSFLAEVAFWFIVLYASITLNPGKILKSGKYGWLGILVIVFGIWYVITESIKITNSLKTPLGVEISILTIILGLLIPWLFWVLFIGLWRLSRSSTQIMLIYSVSVVLTFIRFLNDAMLNTWACELYGMYCQEEILTSFLTEVIVWFLPLYALLKLVSKTGNGYLSVATS